MIKLIVIVVIVSALLGAGYYGLSSYFANQSAQNKPIILTIWGINEDEGQIGAVIAEYKKQKPNVTINFSNQNIQNYRPRVQTQILNNAGPDIYMIHNSWLPMFIQTKSIAPLPSNLMTADQFSTNNYAVATESLTSNGQVLALTREIDGLALYYNQDILKGIGVGVPKSWDEFVQTATLATVVDQQNNIVTAGAALGTTNNVDYWSDILGMLMMQQPGVDINSPESSAGDEVLNFYKSFNDNPNKKVWDGSLDSSTTMFAQGKLAFYFAPASKIDEIKSLNPNLHFSLTSVPQLPSSNSAWASFWAYTVSAKSTNQLEAWKFLKFLTSKDNQKLMFTQARVEKKAGRPYADVSLQKELLTDPLLSPFVSQAPSYKYWFLNYETQDQGINDEMITSFKDAVDNGSLNGINEKIKSVLLKYTQPLATK